MLQYIKEDSELRERFVNYAYAENPNIKNFTDFVDALKKSFDTPIGRNALSEINDEESMALFESEENKEKLRKNVSEIELQEIEDELDEGIYEVQRDVNKGQPTKAGDINVVKTEKRVVVSSAVRTGRRIKPYSKGYQRWTPAEDRFLRVRKQQKLSPKKVISQYNKHFKENRSSSSIKSRLYRS